MAEPQSSEQTKLLHLASGRAAAPNKLSFYMALLSRVDLIVSPFFSTVRLWYARGLLAVLSLGATVGVAVLWNRLHGMCGLLAFPFVSSLGLSLLFTLLLLNTYSERLLVKLLSSYDYLLLAGVRHRRARPPARAPLIHTSLTLLFATQEESVTRAPSCFQHALQWLLSAVLLFVWPSSLLFWLVLVPFGHATLLRPAADSLAAVLALYVACPLMAAAELALGRIRLAPRHVLGALALQLVHLGVVFGLRSAGHCLDWPSPPALPAPAVPAGNGSHVLAAAGEAWSASFPFAADAPSASLSQPALYVSFYGCTLAVATAAFCAQRARDRYSVGEPVGLSCAVSTIQ